MQTVSALCNVSALNGTPGAQYSLDVHHPLHHSRLVHCEMQVTSRAHRVRSMNCYFTEPVDGNIKSLSGAYGGNFTLHTHRALQCPRAVFHKRTQWYTWCTVYSEVYTESSLCSLGALCSLSVLCSLSAWCRCTVQSKCNMRVHCAVYVYLHVHVVYIIHCK